MKKINYILILLIGLFYFNETVNAGSLSVSSSQTSITQGGSVTIYVKANGLAGKFSVTSSNSSVLSGGTSSEWIENETKSYKFTSKSTGKATITVTPIDVADLSNNQKYSAGKSVTITVNKPREKSNNNNLKGLSIDNATLTPEFNKDTLEYKVDLESSIEKININATKEDGYASIEGAGEREVYEGENKLEIVVTSETGNKKTYTIIANVKDNNPIEVNIDNRKYTVVKRNALLIKPDESFVDKKVTLNEIEIPAFYNEKLDLTLIGLKDESGTANLFIYNENNNSYEKYQSFKSNSIIVISKEAKDIPEGYVKTNLKINDIDYIVYKNPKYQGYSLIYGVNLENGTSNWYSYDEKENTIQLYNDKELTELKKDYSEKLDLYKYIIIGLGSFSAFTLLIIIILTLKKKKVKVIKVKEENEIKSTAEESKNENNLDVVDNNKELESKDNDTKVNNKSSNKKKSKNNKE